MSSRLRILCLHGFTSNGAVHAHQVRRITQALPEYEFIFPDGPHHVDIQSQMNMTQPESIAWSELVNKMSASGHRAWYFAREASDEEKEKGEFVGLETSLEKIGKLMEEEGPIHAICGFSQGAGLTGILCALIQESQKGHVLRKMMPKDLAPPLAGIIFSGFKARFSQYDSIYEQGINIPTMHVIGDRDTSVRGERSQALIQLCSRAETLKHDGGHNIPKSAPDVARIVDFVREVVVRDDDTTNR